MLKPVKLSRVPNSFTLFRKSHPKTHECHKGISKLCNPPHPPQEDTRRYLLLTHSYLSFLFHKHQT